MFGKIATCGAALALVFTTLSAVHAASATCEVTGKPRWQCCARKASPMPPCCMKGCSTAVRTMR